MADRLTLMTPRARLSFVQQLFKPKTFKGGSPKYGCTLLFDDAARKTPAWKAIEEAAEAAKIEKFGSKAAGMRLRSPFLDGNDYPQYAGYAGMIFLRVSTEYKPDFVDRQNQQIPFDQLEDQIYSGCYARATLNVYGYDTDGNRGVAFGLRNIQKLGEGDKLGGKVSAESEFGAIEDDGGNLDEAFASDNGGRKTADQYARDLVG